MASYIRRRKFLATLLGGAAAWLLDRLTQVFYEKALAGDVQSGLLTVRI